MEINVAELKAVCLKIFEDLESQQIKSVELKHDFYWTIDPSQKYRPEQEPELKSLTLGQLSDDWKDIQDMSRGEYDPIVQNFADVAPLLAYISEYYFGEFEKS